jgi:hypothetical protein
MQLDDLSHWLKFRKAWDPIGARETPLCLDPALWVAPFDRVLQARWIGGTNQGRDMVESLLELSS